MLPLLWKGIIAEVGLGSKLVTSLTDFQGNGHNVTCDNFFIDLKLAESLVKERLTIIATVKRNKRFLPKDFLEKKSFTLLRIKISLPIRDNKCAVPNVTKMYMKSTTHQMWHQLIENPTLSWNTMRQMTVSMPWTKWQMLPYIRERPRDGPLPFS